MTTTMDNELIFSPLHAIFVFFLTGFAALAILFAFIAYFSFSI